MAGAVEPVPLLEGRREWLAFFLAVLLLAGAHLAWRYREYRRFVDRPLAYGWGRVVWMAPRAEKGRIRVKVCLEEGPCFWSRWRDSHRDLTGRRVRLKLYLRRSPSFVRYLGTPYLPSRVLELSPDPPDLRSRLGSWIRKQHDSREVGALYRALFLADPLPKDLRRDLSILGVNHLVALSGFHLGLLAGGLWLLLGPIYRRIQRRYFPWRHELRDLGAAVMLLLAGYLWLTGAPPSLLRAYAMTLLGWWALLAGLEIKSYGFLAFVAGILILLFPELLFSWGFWLSLTGVYLIYLLLHRLSRIPPRIMGTVLIPAGLFFLMGPIVHSLFDLLSPWQWLSIPLSMIFVLFYPLAGLLHLLGIGGVLDGGWETLEQITREAPVYQRILPGWFLGVYGVLLLAAARWKKAFWGVWIAAAVAWGWLLAQ